MNRSHRLLLTAGLALGLVACELSVVNEEGPETGRVLATPGDVETLIASSWLSWWNGSLGLAPESSPDPGIQAQMSTVSFEHSATAANFGMIERSAIPRLPIGNNDADQFAPQYKRDWYTTYSAIRAATDGLVKINEGLVIGDATRTARARAFAKFVQGLAYGTLALTYDRAIVVDETTPPDPPPTTLAPYGEVMSKALGYLDDAITVAQANTFTLPDNWINGSALTNTELAALAHSYKARYRAQVARTPAERAAVDWNAVIADAQAGISADVSLTTDDNVWVQVLTEYHSFGGAWQQSFMFVLGMADTSGGYQAWMSTPLTSRMPFLIRTPDLRFPRGDDQATQSVPANFGSYIRWNGSAGHLRSDRGTWRWSFYKDYRFQSYWDAAWVGPFPFFRKVELDLLQAEGYIRTAQEALAVPIINATRTANGLLAVTTAGVPAPPAGATRNCVPRLPDGSCGSLLEALKWEKRLEMWSTVYGGWFFDSRGWGDLHEGTAIHYPVPARELQVLQASLYTFGGVGGAGSAPVGTYGY
jgi:hypothetical protein